MSAIVTNARNRIAYNVVRSLGEKGVPVYAADFVPRSMSFASRYTKGHFVYPSPFRDPAGFVACVIQHVQELRARVLIPVFEETFLVAKHKEHFAAHVALAVPDYDQILAVHNKDRWERLARAMDIAVPRTFCPRALRETTELNDVRFPVLIKPKQGGGAWAIQEVPTRRVLESLLAEPGWANLPWGRFFVQEKIAGQTHCVAMLFSHGAIKAKVGYRQLRDYPATGGQATLRISLRHEQAEAHFQRLLEQLKWHGPCQADFIIDEQTGVPYLIDINPRLWGSLAQAIASGVDFPYLIYRLALEGDIPAALSFKTGVVTRWIGGELAAFPARLRQSSSKFGVMRDFVFPAKRTELFDDFSVTDPLPFLAWTLDAVNRAVTHRSLQRVTHDSLDGIWE